MWWLVLSGAPNLAPRYLGADPLRDRSSPARYRPDRLLPATECGCHPGDVADNSLVDLALASGLVQPDQTTCGSCVLVMARMLDDPSYVGFLVNGVNPASGER